MITEIHFLNNDGMMPKVAIYTLPPKKALVCAIMQHVHKDYNTNSYPEEISGMWAGQNGSWYYDNGDCILGAFVKED